METDTIPRRLFDHAARRPAAPAYFTKRGGTWVPTSYVAHAHEVKRAGKALMALGCAPGSTVAILGFNRPEWVVFQLASMAIGGAPAGIYTTSSPSEVRYVLEHAAARVVLMENELQLAKIGRERASLPHLAWVVTMRGSAGHRDATTLDWDSFLARGDGVSDGDFFARLHALEPGGLATLIYTSGTTGPPKGVMLSHENLAWMAKSGEALVGSTPADTNLSFLPLSHIAEQIFSVHGPITSGGATYFAESLEKVPENLREVRPTIFFAVPRLWEKFHAGVAGKMAQAQGAQKVLLDWSLSVGRRVYELRMRGARVPRRLRLQHRVARRLVFSKIKAAIGLDRARLFVSGAAPIARELLEFFGSIDVPICEGYGMSENAGSTTLNLPGATRLGSVGRAVPGAELRIAADGEILMRSPSVFLGYFKDPAATAEAMQDGWLKTGDLGSLDDAGYLSITGRKKEIIITAGGKNVAPSNIEAALKNTPLVGEAMIVGDRRKFLAALVTLDLDATERFRHERGLPSETSAHDDPAIVAEVQRAVDAVNAELARVEQVKRFRILPRSFSVETGELTPTLKLRRSIVARKFALEIETMYER
jgi:long-chain acyl-CoA synthetase